MYTLSNPSFPVSHKDQNNECDSKPDHFEGSKHEIETEDVDECASPLRRANSVDS
jgi:hypothetical protein